MTCTGRSRCCWDDAGAARASALRLPRLRSAPDGEVTEERDADNAASGADHQDPTNPYRYSDKRVDASASDPRSGTGLIDMGARQFSPYAASFLQQDYLTDPGADLGLSTDLVNDNRYALAGGNPVSFIDSDGHAATLSDQNSPIIQTQGGDVINRETERVIGGPRGLRRSQAARRQGTPSIRRRGPERSGDAPLSDTVLSFGHFRMPFVGAAPERLKVPDPGEALLDRLWGRDWVYPEGCDLLLEASAGGSPPRATGRMLGVAPKGAARTRLVPGGGLKAHEAPTRGHTLSRHVDVAEDALRRRLATTPRLSTVWASSTRAMAEEAIRGASDGQSPHRRNLFIQSGGAQVTITQTFNRAASGMPWHAGHRGRQLVNGVKSSAAERSVKSRISHQDELPGPTTQQPYPDPFAILLQAYFNQDWDLDAHDPREVLHNFVRDEPEADIRAAAAERPACSLQRAMRPRSRPGFVPRAWSSTTQRVTA